MTNENKTYERHINKKGKRESQKSCNTFYDTYLPTNPSPTYKQLAKLTGHTESTCSKWITENEYRQRKQKILEQQKQEQNNAIKKNTETIQPLIAKINQLMIQDHLTIREDTHTRLQKTKTMKTKDPQRIQLHHEDLNNNKSYQLIIDNIHNTNTKIDDYIKQASQNTTVYNELLEKIETQQNQQSLQTTQQLEEEYQDEQY